MFELLRPATRVPASERIGNVCTLGHLRAGPRTRLHDPGARRGIRSSRPSPARLQELYVLADELSGEYGCFSVWKSEEHRGSGERRDRAEAAARLAGRLQGAPNRWFFEVASQPRAPRWSPSEWRFGSERSRPRPAAPSGSTNSTGSGRLSRLTRQPRRQALAARTAVARREAAGAPRANGRPDARDLARRCAGAMLGAVDGVRHRVL